MLTLTRVVAVRDEDPHPDRATISAPSGKIASLIGDGPCRDRTCDLGIKSPLLYQLS